MNIMYLVYMCTATDENCTDGPIKFDLDIICSSLIRAEKYIDDWVKNSSWLNNSDYKAHPNMKKDNNYTFIGTQDEVINCPTSHHLMGWFGGFVIQEFTVDEPLPLLAEPKINNQTSPT